jgi:hypothetical protein
MAELAAKAEGGCPAASAALIALAKESDDAEAAKLAARAEGGCEHSKEALIAMAKDSESE